MCSNEEVALRHALCALSGRYANETDGPELFTCAKCHAYVQLTGEDFHHDRTRIGWLPPCWHAVHWSCAGDTCASCNKPTPAVSRERAPPVTDSHMATLTQLVRAIGAAPPLRPAPAGGAAAVDAGSKRPCPDDNESIMSSVESLLGPVISPSAAAAATSAGSRPAGSGPAGSGKPRRSFAAKYDTKQKCAVCGNTWKKNDMICFTGRDKDIAHAGCMQAL